jgi:hypothetical protein
MRSITNSSLYAFALTLSVVGCSNEHTGFGGSNGNTGSNKSAASAENASKSGGTIRSSGESAAQGKLIEEKFTATKNAGKIDIAWYVDQSGSMGAETQLVKENIEKFMTSVTTFTDARVALVATSSGDKALTLSAPSESRVQVNQVVRSNDALAIAINTFAKDSSALPTGVTNYSGALGKLSNFFREGVPSVIVVVTDDNAKQVTQSNFITHAKATLGREPRLFAFAASNSSPYVGQPNCTVAADGTAYVEIASITKGEVFDICEPDWKDNLAKLTSGVLGAAQNSFVLRSAPSSIKEVRVNGRKLLQSEYTNKGSVLTVATSALDKTKDSTVEVVYAK